MIVSTFVNGSRHLYWVLLIVTLFYWYVVKSFPVCQQIFQMHQQNPQNFFKETIWEALLYFLLPFSYSTFNNCLKSTGSWVSWLLTIDVAFNVFTMTKLENWSKKCEAGSSLCMAVKNREYFLLYYETPICSSSNCNFFWLDFPSLWNSFTPAYSLASQDIRNSGGLEANLWSRKVLIYLSLWAKYTLCRSMLTQTLERPLHKVRDGICKSCATSILPICSWT